MPPRQAIPLISEYQAANLKGGPEQRTALYCSHPRRSDPPGRLPVSCARAVQTGPHHRPARQVPPPPRSPGHDQQLLPAGPDQYLTLDELVVPLKLDQETILAEIISGKLPGRCFGHQWCFSRHAVLPWLDGSSAPGAASVRIWPITAPPRADTGQSVRALRLRRWGVVGQACACGHVSAMSAPRLAR